MGDVVHCKRSAYDVYVGRGRCPRTGQPGEWGNPFTHKDGTTAAFRVATREDAIARYREWLLAQSALVEKARRELRGMTLGCWCAPQSCHGDVLAEVANSEACEGCNAPATHHDVEGVPLCAACYATAPLADVDTLSARPSTPAAEGERVVQAAEAWARANRVSPTPDVAQNVARTEAAVAAEAALYDAVDALSAPRPSTGPAGERGREGWAVVTADSGEIADNSGRTQGGGFTVYGSRLVAEMARGTAAAATGREFVVACVVATLAARASDDPARLREMLRTATVRLGILRDRMAGCEERHPDTHRVSLLEVPGWIEEQEAALAAPAAPGNDGDPMALGADEPPCAECGDPAAAHPWVPEHQDHYCPSSPVMALTFYRAAPAAPAVPRG